MAIGNPKRQFSSREIRQLARDYGEIYLMGFHDHYDITAQFAAAKAIESVNPHAGVFTYYNTRIWFTAWTDHWGHWAQGFKRTWLLKGRNGRPIPFYGQGHTTGKPVGYYVDLTNRAYRAWATDLLVRWMREAPLAGVLLDAADFIGVTEKDLTKWVRLIGRDRVDAYNTGMKEFVQAVRQALAPLEKKVLYNGIAPSPLRGPGRNKSLLSESDGAFDEAFCLSLPVPKQKQSLIPPALDLSIMRAVDAQGKQVIMSAVFSNDTWGAGPYCLAAFLMGWVPGSSYFHFGSGYKEGELTKQVPEINLDLGRPDGKYAKSGSLLSRRFQHGLVAVNLGSSAASITLSHSMVRFARGKSGKRYAPSSTLRIGPHAGAFLLDASFVRR